MIQNTEWIKKQIEISSSVFKQTELMCAKEILSGSKAIINAIEKGNKVLWCGNGGSAADAQHMSAELMGGLTTHERPPIASIALTTDTSFITAWSNDTDYNSIFSRQIYGIGNEGDVLVAISTSGNSKNIIYAINEAKNKKIHTLGLTNQNGGEMNNICDVLIKIPSEDTQRVQEGHLLVEHIICEMVETYFLNS